MKSCCRIWENVTTWVWILKYEEWNHIVVFMDVNAWVWIKKNEIVNMNM